jgi:predicted 2-oxoglutarate/Fe(II)-dependent dioxygenase YbiX
MRYLYWQWESVIPLLEIKEINKRIKDFVHEGQNRSAEGVAKSSIVKHVEYGLIQDKIKPYVDMFILRNTQSFGYNLFPLNSQTVLNYNIYKDDQSGEYDWHIDAESEFENDVKLTALLNLSEKEFEGGDFNLNWGNIKTINEFKKPGSLLIFKSHVLHQVTPVTKGTRKTLAIFFTGPRFI